MNYYNSMGFGSYGGFGFAGPLFVVVMLWTLYWKGRALWTAAKKDSKYWFVALLLINTAGILEIAYIYYFSKKEFCCGGGGENKCEGKCEDKKDGECCKDGKCEVEKNGDIPESCDCGHEHK